LQGSPSCFDHSMFLLTFFPLVLRPSVLLAFFLRMDPPLAGQATDCVHVHPLEGEGAAHPKCECGGTITHSNAPPPLGLSHHWRRGRGGGRPTDRSMAPLIPSFPTQSGYTSGSEICFHMHPYNRPSQCTRRSTSAHEHPETSAHRIPFPLAPPTPMAMTGCFCPQYFVNSLCI